MAYIKEKPQFGKWLADGIDATIGVFSPKAAFQRKRDRMRLEIASRFSNYAGARKDRLYGNWWAGSESADAALFNDLAALRDRSRQLNRDDGVASGTTNAVVHNTIGTGIKPQCRVDWESVPGMTEDLAGKFCKRVENAWKRWCEESDAGERTGFYEMQGLIDRSILEAGEVIVLPLRVQEKYREFSLALEAVEADRLRTPFDKKSDKAIREGVHLGKRNQPLGYWIRKTHPGEALLNRFDSVGDDSSKYIYVPRRNQFGAPNAFHLYAPLRPGQTRGVPFFAPVMTKFKDLADYLEAEIVAARVAACFAVFIESNDPISSATANLAETNSRNQRTEEIEPGIIERLNAGEKIQSVDPGRPTSSFEPFVEQMLRMISGGLNLPYEIVAKDFSKTNYSSARAALLEARRFFQMRQGWMSIRFCQPVYVLLMEEMFLRGMFDDLGLTSAMFYQYRPAFTQVTWVAPGWGWVDPKKEIESSLMAVDGGVSTLAEECAAVGRDWEDVMTQLKREQDYAKNLGLDLNKKKQSASNPTDKNEDEQEESKQEDE